VVVQVLIVTPTNEIRCTVYMTYFSGPVKLTVMPFFLYSHISLKRKWWFLLQSWD